MKVYLPWRPLPELANLDRRSRRRIWRRCYYKTLRHWQVWAGVAIWLVICVLFFILPAVRVNRYMIDQYYPDPKPPWFRFAGALWGLLVLYIGALVWYQFLVPIVRPYLRKALQQESQPE
jgi:hypothetical protein